MSDIQPGDLIELTYVPPDEETACRVRASTSALGHVYRGLYLESIPDHEHPSGLIRILMTHHSCEGSGITYYRNMITVTLITNCWKVTRIA